MPQPLDNAPSEVRVPWLSPVARGRCLLLLAALFWSTSGVLMNSPAMLKLDKNDRGPLVACYRALVAGICLLPFVDFRRITFSYRLIPMVGCFALMNALFVSAMSHTSAAIAIFLQYTSTFWAFAFGAILLRERITRQNIIALCLGMLGIGWIIVEHWAGDHFFGAMLALGSGMAYGGVVVSLRFLRDEDSAWLISLNHLVSGAILIPWVVCRGLVPNVDQAIIITVLGIFQMALPYVLFAKAVRTVEAQEAGLLTLPEAILNPLWVWILWGQPVDASTWIAGSFIFAGVLLSILTPARRSLDKTQ